MISEGSAGLLMTKQKLTLVPLQRLLTHDIFLSFSADQQTCVLNSLTLAVGSPYVWWMAKGHNTNNTVVSAVTPDSYILYCKPSHSYVLRSYFKNPELNQDPSTDISPSILTSQMPFLIDTRLQ